MIAQPEATIVSEETIANKSQQEPQKLSTKRRIAHHFDRMDVLRTFLYVLMALCFFDIATTNLALTNFGATEANPVMDAVIKERGWPFMFAMKVILTAVVSISLYGQKSGWFMSPEVYVYYLWHKKNKNAVASTVRTIPYVALALVLVMTYVVSSNFVIMSMSMAFFNQYHVVAMLIGALALMWAGIGGVLIPAKSFRPSIGWVCLGISFALLLIAGVEASNVINLSTYAPH